MSLKIKTNFIIGIALLVVSASPSGAVCCIPYQLAVVAGAGADIVALEAYNSSLNSTLRSLRSAVALEMAISVEKERQCADASAIKKSMGVRADAESLLIRAKIVAVDAELYSLSQDYKEEIQKEIITTEEIK